MKKKQVQVFGRTNYLLGETEDGTRYYLEQPKFDCGWYWGGLYVETFTNNLQPERSRDIQSHSHVDTMFLNKDWDTFRKFFKHTVLTDKEIWKFLELSKTFYILKEYAGLVHHGGAHVTTNSCYDVLKDDTKWLDVVKVQMPNVIAELISLLGGTVTVEELVSKMDIYN